MASWLASWRADICGSERGIYYHPLKGRQADPAVESPIEH